MKTLARRLAPVLAVCFMLGIAQAQAQCINLASQGATAVETFNGLSNGAGSTTNALSLPGWALNETGGGARDNELYAVDTGASTTGDTYSYGAAGSSDRALGSLRSGTAIATFGACYTNNTGAPLTVLGVEYTAEQWRVGTLGRLDSVSFEYSLDATSLTTGAWTTVPALGFATPDINARNGVGSVGARDGNVAANRLAVSGSISGITVAQGATIWLRWVDADASGADDGMAVDDLSVTAGGINGTPILSINDNAVTEGDEGVVTALFTVSLSKPAGAGGASFDYLTHDLTASATGGDYTDTSGTATIPEGQTSVTIGVVVNGDTVDEGNETFVFDTTNLVGATGIGGKGSAIGTIYNDDMPKTPIHDVQGTGAMSPLVGSTVTVRGVVTGRKSNGFFVQAPDAEVDADPLTSEAVFVFTNAAPPAAATVGNLVLATGVVAEYIPSADPGQLPLTELTAPTVLQVSTGQPLPMAMALTTLLPAPNGGLGQLERYEGMRVTADSFTVVAPTKGSTNETSASGTSNGIFSVVVTGVARPFREPGIQIPDPDPTGTTATAIPRWDFNPEMLTVDSDAIGGTQLNIPAGTVLGNLVGPLDYGFRRYTILPEAGTPVNVGALPLPTAARLPTADEFTVAGYNMERFFDTTNDPAISEPVLTADAFEKRLAKASLAIRDYLHSPDIVAVVEVENLSTLKTLADRINADAAAAPQPSFPGYVPYLVDGNDVGGIDVGFLVKTLEAGGVERVHVANVMQYGKSETWVDPSDNTQHLLNDRPPLLLDAEVHFSDGVFPVKVLVVHQRSLNAADSEIADGLTTEGDRVRRKRQAQAEYLANLVQSLQIPWTNHLVVLGDFNAFEFNDGYADVMNTVIGTPTADDQTAVNGDGADLMNPNLINLGAFADPGEHYSFVFDGNAQSLDHVLVNERLFVDAVGISLDHAHINADFPETARNDETSPARLSDHDPAIAYIDVGVADLAITTTAASEGTFMGFEARLTNAGPKAARFPGIGFSFDAELPLLQTYVSGGWSCDAPVVAAGTTTVACASYELDQGAVAGVDFTTNVPPEKIYAPITMVASVTSRTFDPDLANNSVSVSVTATPIADLGVSISRGGRNGGLASYDIVVRNDGPDAALAATLQVDTDIRAGAVALSNDNVGWTCTRADTTAFRSLCVMSAQDLGAIGSGQSRTFRLTLPAALDKPQFKLSGSVTSPGDPASGNNEARRRLGIPNL